MAIVQVSANALAQEVTLSEKKASIEKVIDKISEQTGYDFVFNKEILAAAKPISITLTNVALKDALIQIFRNQPLNFTIKEQTVIISKKETSTTTNSTVKPELVLQDDSITVSGRVTDSIGNPLQGASVRVKDHKLSTITNRNGEFLLRNVPEDVTLQISYLGYESREIPAFADLGGIVLRISQAALQEIKVDISTGFQQVPKERATGSFSFIDNAIFNEQISTDVLSRLEAITNGLNVDHLSQDNDLGIRIRGQSTFSDGSMKDPLIILDNFPFEGDLNNINPNDVENITLLKDAAASSIWGARAANGVIVITTRRAKRNQPITIDFNSNVTVSPKPDLMYYDLMSPAEFIEVERFLFSNGYRFSDTASSSRPAFSPVYEILFRQRAGEISESEANSLIDGLGRTDIRNEYLKYIYEPSLNQQYALSIQGGGDNTAWYFSTGYDRNKSDLSDKNDRLTINFRNTYSPIQNLQLETGLMYVQSKSVAGKTGFSNGDMYPYTKFADENGNPLPADNRTLSTYRQSYLDTLGGGKLLDWKYYPLTDDDHQTSRSTLNHALLNFNVHYKPVNWLGLDVKYQYGRQQSKGENLREEESYFARNLINMFSQFNASGDVVYNVPRGAILDLSHETLESHNLRGQVEVPGRWGKHGVDVLVGFEASHTGVVNSGNRTYGYDKDILTFSQVDYLGLYRRFVEQYNSYIPQNQYFNDQTNRFVSSFLNGAYTFDSKYTVSFSGRRDASNLFGVNTNDRWNLLWSTGLSWEINKERFYNFNSLPYLRLRATYGFSGNTDQSRSAVTTIYYSGTSSNIIGAPTAYVSQNANPELRWEKIRMMNFALDFRFNNNWLSGSFDFFFKHGTDLLGPDPVDYTTGISGSITRNISELKGKGFDLELRSLNVANNNWKWNTTLNLSYYDDKVVSYYRSTLNPSNYVQYNVGAATNIEGERMYALYSYRWAGLDPETGEPMFYLNGVPSKDYSAIGGGAEAQMEDLVNHGSAIPLLFGNIGNNIQYKSFGLSFNLMFKFNYYIRTNALRYDLLYQGITGFSEWNRRWQKQGDELFTDVPSMVYPINSQRETLYANSEIKVERGDHIRLQYVNLHYDLASQGLLNSKIRNLRIYFNMANMGIIWKRGNYVHDPMYGYNTIPPAETYSFGVRASF